MHTEHSSNLIPPEKQSVAQSLARLWPYAKFATPRLALGAGAALVGAVVALLIPQQLRFVVDGPIASGDFTGLIWAMIFIGLLGILEAFMVWARRFLVLVPGTEVERRLRVQLFSRLQRLPVGFHDRWQGGQLLSRAVGDLNRVRRWIAFGIVILVTSLITIIVGLIMLALINPILAAIFLVGAIPIVIYTFRFDRKFRVVARRSQDLSGDLATSVEESVHGIRVLKSFGRGRFKYEQFMEQANELKNVEMTKAKSLAGILFVNAFVPDIIYGATLILGIAFAVSGQISTGDLVAYFATATVLRLPIEMIGFLLALTLETRAAVDRYFEVMDSPVLIEDPINPIEIDQPQGRLTFENVAFAFDDARDGDTPLIHDLSLEILPGESMALVGTTGSGKTTLSGLAARLYDVTAGSVRIDGVDVRDLTLDELTSIVSVAFEESILFSASVRDNVLLGAPDATDEELERALTIAQAQFAFDLPEGVDTRIGEQGMSLSGGQRQRLALARAVAAHPKILVLDDPLSALDVDTEAKVQERLRSELHGTTSLIVAHRPSTVALADRVALLENGTITAVGTHRDLLATSDHYRFVIASLDDDFAENQASENDEFDAVVVDDQDDHLDGDDRTRRTR